MATRGRKQSVSAQDILLTMINDAINDVSDGNYLGRVASGREETAPAQVPSTYGYLQAARAAAPAAPAAPVESAAPATPAIPATPAAPAAPVINTAPVIRQMPDAYQPIHVGLPPLSTYMPSPAQQSAPVQSFSPLSTEVRPDVVQAQERYNAAMGLSDYPVEPNAPLRFLPNPLNTAVRPDVAQAQERYGAAMGLSDYPVQQSAPVQMLPNLLNTAVRPDVAQAQERYGAAMGIYSYPAQQSAPVQLLPNPLNTAVRPDVAQAQERYNAAMGIYDYPVQEEAGFRFTAPIPIPYPATTGPVANSNALLNTHAPTTNGGLLADSILRNGYDYIQSADNRSPVQIIPR